MPGTRFDRSRNIRWHAKIDTAFYIQLTLHCSKDLGRNGSLAALSVVGLKLQFSGDYGLEGLTDNPDSEPLLLIPWILAIFHSKLRAFPDLRVAEVQWDMDLLRLISKGTPEISQVPTFDEGLVYQWGCYCGDLGVTDDVYYYRGINPVTLEPSGASKLLCTNYALLTEHVQDISGVSGERLIQVDAVTFDTRATPAEPQC